MINLSGQTLTIGHWIAGAGAIFAFLAPILGWIGTAVTGSGTSATALFASLQQTAAEGIGVEPRLLVAANTVGGAVGKMLSPQTLAIAATAVADNPTCCERRCPGVWAYWWHCVCWSACNPLQSLVGWFRSPAL